MYSLLEYSDNYSKTSANLWHYCDDEPALNNNVIADFNDGNNTDSFNSKVRTTGQTGNNGAKNSEVAVPLKYLNNF